MADEQVKANEVAAVKKPVAELIEVSRKVNLLPFERKDGDKVTEGFIVHELFDLARNGLLPGQTKAADEKEAINLATIVTNPSNKLHASDAIRVYLENVYHQLSMKGLPLPAYRSESELARTWVSNQKEAASTAVVTYGSIRPVQLKIEGHYPTNAIQKWMPRVGMVVLEGLLVSAALLTSVTVVSTLAEMTLLGSFGLLAPVAAIGFYLVHKADKSGGVGELLGIASEEIARNLSGKYKNAGQVNKMQLAKSVLFTAIALPVATLEGLGIFGAVSGLLASSSVIAGLPLVIPAIAGVLGAAVFGVSFGFIYLGMRALNRLGLRAQSLVPNEPGVDLNQLLVASKEDLSTNEDVKASYTDRADELKDDLNLDSEQKSILIRLNASMTTATSTTDVAEDVEKKNKISLTA